ncbi:MAG: hypothetical protein V3R52_07450 [Candidatus Neomarinimicrobiota bacterium]
MVKVINPLFSNSARGRFGGLVYQTGIYGQYVRTHVLQHRRPSPAQLQQNYFFGVAADSWRVLTDLEKAEYNTRAVPFRITGFNLFIKENIEHP